MQDMWVWSLDPDDPLEKEMATHSNILAWNIPRTEEQQLFKQAFLVILRWTKGWKP